MDKLEIEVKELEILFDTFESPLYDVMYAEKAKRSYVKYFTENKSDVLEMQRNYFNRFG